MHLRHPYRQYCSECGWHTPHFGPQQNSFSVHRKILSRRFRTKNSYSNRSQHFLSEMTYNVFSLNPPQHFRSDDKKWWSEYIVHVLFALYELATCNAHTETFQWQLIHLWLWTLLLWHCWHYDLSRWWYWWWLIMSIALYAH